MADTKQTVDPALVQALLDQLLEIAESNGLTVGKDLFVTAALEHGGLIEIYHTVHSGIYGFAGDWINYGMKGFFNLSYDPVTKTVRISEKGIIPYISSSEYSMGWIFDVLKTLNGKWELKTLQETKLRLVPIPLPDQH